MNFVKRSLIPRKCISCMFMSFTYLTSFFFFFVYCVCVCLFDSCSVLACNDGYQFKLHGECLSLIMSFFYRFMVV